MSDQEASPAQKASAEFRERLERLDRQASAAPMGRPDHRATLDLRACLGLPGAMVRRVIPASLGKTELQVQQVRRAIEATSVPRVTLGARALKAR